MSLAEVAIICSEHISRWTSIIDLITYLGLEKEYHFWIVEDIPKKGFLFIYRDSKRRMDEAASSITYHKNESGITS